MKIAVVIPAKDEEGSIGKVIEEVKNEIENLGHESEIIVSSSSRDSTDSISIERDAKVITDGGTGLGEAMFRGLKKALDFEPGLIVSIDADYQFQPTELPKLIEASNECELVLGSRFLESGVTYDMSFSHRVGNKILTGMTNHFTGLSITDAQTGYRVMKPEVVKSLRMVGRHTYVQETIIDAHSNGFSIKEVPVEFHPRKEGGSKVVKSIQKYAFRTLPVILHRSGYTTYLMNGIGIIGVLIAAVIGIISVLSWNLFLFILGMIIGFLSLQTMYLGMFIDSELP